MKKFLSQFHSEQFFLFFIKNTIVPSRLNSNVLSTTIKQVPVSFTQKNQLLHSHTEFGINFSILWTIADIAKDKAAKF